ncbi:MAG: acetate--CoA ligase family protein [Candidatus Caenarcaniphilales bacterium]|nr:acetate--CoA ligase family protein [Candidatus Caenarcaniphilales bacterium]
MDERIQKIFNPESIALIGATERRETVSYAVLNNLLTMGYQGKIYPVNPKRDKVLSLKAYPSVSAIPEKVDLAVIATPAQTVPEIVKECGDREIQSLVTITSGFSEIGEQGKVLEAEIQRYCLKYGIRMIGPNCLGVINPSRHMNASFAGKMPYAGKVGFISQSGALCTSILDWAIQHQIGFSNFVSVGSMLDLEFADLIDYFNEDRTTAGIIMYIESIKKPEEFIAAARRFTRQKPIFAIKSGRFEEGSKAAASHTGAVAGADDIYDAALERAGIVRVKRVIDLINVAQSLSMQTIPTGNRLCIVTNAGGPGVISTDALIERGGALAPLSDETRQELDQVLPPFWSHSNPVDVLGDAQADRYEKAVDICLRNPHTDGLMVIFTPQAMSEPVPTARAVARLAKIYHKPVFTAWMGAEYVLEGSKLLQRNGVPSFTTPEPSIDAFTRAYYAHHLNQLLNEVEEEGFAQGIEVAGEVQEKFRFQIADLKQKGERNFLNEIESKDLMEAYGIPTTGTKLAQSADEAVGFAEKIGYPVVLKIQSPDILHKSDAGGVMLNLNDSDQVRQSFVQIIESARTYDAKAKLEGVTVQKMVQLSGGIEFLLGMKNDPIWKHTIICGMGGVMVELIKDKCVLLPPLNRKLIELNLSRTKVFKLLEGFRGEQGADLDCLYRIILNFAQLVKDFPEIQELDINPLLIKGSEAYALDARVIF